MSIRPPDRKIVLPGLIEAPPRYPPEGGLVTFRQLRPASSDIQAVLSCSPAPGSSPQPRNSPPPGAAASAPDHAPLHGTGTGRQRAEPFTGPACSNGLPRAAVMASTQPTPPATTTRADPAPMPAAPRTAPHASDPPPPA